MNITTILNLYRRPQNLKKQIESIRDQTIKTTDVWLWRNLHQDNEQVDLKSFDVDKTFDNNFNWKFYGRFSAALLSQSDYIAVFDDDTIPGKRWFENCLNSINQCHGILGSAGVVLNSRVYRNHTRVGWPSLNTEIQRVDLVGHAWFFKSEWLKYMWFEKPFMLDNGEDIQFSYLAQKFGKINTYCPPHPKNDKSLHGSLEPIKLGGDKVATSKNTVVSHKTFFSQRNLCVEHAIDNGWNTVKNIK